MTTDQMQTFLLAARLNSFTEAAQRLFVTQSAVSRQIIAMERELDTQLFIRSNSRVTLSAAGGVLRDGLEKICGDYQALTEHVRNMKTGSEGSVRIGLLFDQYLSDIVRTAIRGVGQHKNVQISIVRMSDTDLTSALADGDIDVAVTLFQSPSAPPGMSRLVFAREYLCTAADPSLFPGGILPGNPRDVMAMDIPCVIPSTEVFSKFTQEQIKQRRMLETPFLPNVTYTDDYASIPLLVSAGLTAAAVNESHILCTEPGIVMIPVEEAEQIEKGLQWLSGNDNPILKELVRMVGKLMSSGKGTQQHS